MLDKPGNVFARSFFFYMPWESKQKRSTKFEGGLGVRKNPRPHPAAVLRDSRNTAARGSFSQKKGKKKPKRYSQNGASYFGGKWAAQPGFWHKNSRARLVFMPQTADFVQFLPALAAGICAANPGFLQKNSRAYFQKYLGTFLSLLHCVAVRINA